MVVARWLNPSYGRTGEFIKTRLNATTTSTYAR
jgi:hypothetical protein